MVCMEYRIKNREKDNFIKEEAKDIIEYSIYSRWLSENTLLGYVNEANKEIEWQKWYKDEKFIYKNEIRLDNNFVQCLLDKI